MYLASFNRKQINFLQKNRLFKTQQLHSGISNLFSMSEPYKLEVGRPKFEQNLNPYASFSLERLQKCFTPKPINSTRVISMHKATVEGKDEYMSGGDILSRIDLIASFSIQKLGGLFSCPTRSMDAVHFLVPVKVGSLLIYKARINRVWNTSLEVSVNVQVDDGVSGLKHCCSSLLTFVLVKGPLDSEGQLRLPQVYPVGDHQTRFFEESHKRRLERLKNAKTTNEEISAFRSYLMNDPQSKENPTFCEMVELVLPTYANFIESTFGGQIMKWMEDCAGISAGRFSKRSNFMSASSDAIQFVKPSRVGDSMLFRSVVTRSFKTSMEIYVVVTRFPKGSDQEEFTNDGFFTFVAKSNPSADLSKVGFIPSNKHEQAMFNSAENRRKTRLENVKHLLPPKI